MHDFDVCINNATIKVALFVETKLRVICMYIVLKSNSAKSHSLLSHTFTFIYSIHVSWFTNLSGAENSSLQNYKTNEHRKGFLKFRGDCIVSSM